MKIVFATYDNQSVHNSLPLGATYVAAYLRANGYPDISFYCQDVYHYPDSHLTKFVDEEKPDIISLGFVAGYYQHQKIKLMVDAIRRAQHKPYIVLGGHGPSPVPEFYLRYTQADAVVMGEAEVPFLNMVKVLDGHGSFVDTKGIAFRYEDTYIVNPREEPIKNLDSIPFPAYDLLPMEYYINSKMLNIGAVDRQIAMISSRGCAFKCNFCMRLEKGLRFRSAANVKEELKLIVNKYNLSYILFYDEYFAASKKRVKEITEAISSIGRPVKYFCTGRLDMIDEDILQMLKDSGCASLDFGIEQYDDAALKAMDKRLTEREIKEGIELTKQYGIAIAFNIIFGNIGDTRESLKKSIDFLSKYNDYSQLRVIRPVTPYPGSPLYDHAIKTGLLKGPEDFYEKHRNLELLTTNFTLYTDEEVHQMLFEANARIINDYYEHKRSETIKQFEDVYFKKDIGFRGARHN
jgi:anaerobic magnesium-protoporphyrin IX monomethyl ester cyclase